MINKLNGIFEEILFYAERNQKCLRKAVGCAAVSFQSEREMEPFSVLMQHNGPSRPDHKCTNEVGNCGCSHSEPRVVQQMLKQREMVDAGFPLILVCTYSPCTNCANIVIDSGLFTGIIYDILTAHDLRGEKFLREAMPVLNRNEFNRMSDKEASDTVKKWISC